MVPPPYPVDRSSIVATGLLSSMLEVCTAREACEIKNTLCRVLLAGSGSTCYGIRPDVPKYPSSHFLRDSGRSATTEGGVLGCSRIC